MSRRRRHRMTLVEWLIVMGIAAIMLSMLAPSRPRVNRRPPRARRVSVPAPQHAGSPVDLPATAKSQGRRVGGVWLWRGARELIGFAISFLFLGRIWKRLPRSRRTDEAEASKQAHRGCE